MAQYSDVYLPLKRPVLYQIRMVKKAYVCYDCGCNYCTQPFAQPEFSDIMSESIR